MIYILFHDNIEDYECIKAFFIAYLYALNMEGNAKGIHHIVKEKSHSSIDYINILQNESLNLFENFYEKLSDQKIGKKLFLKDEY